MAVIVYKFSSLPSPLVDSQQRSALVLRVVGDNHTHEQSQSDHAAQEYIHVDVDCVHLRQYIKIKLGKGLFGNCYSKLYSKSYKIELTIKSGLTVFEKIEP